MNQQTLDEIKKVIGYLSFPNAETPTLAGSATVEVCIEKLKKIIQPFKDARFDYTEFHQVDFPYSIDYNGKRYCSTGKKGTTFKDNMPSAEYKQISIDSRIWLRLDGTIMEE